MKNYRVTLRVNVRTLPTLLTVIEGTNGIELLNLNTETAPTGGSAASPLEGEPKTTPRFRNGKRNKGMTGRQLVLEALKLGTGVANRTTLKAAFDRQGFAPNSMSAALSAAAKEKLIKYNRESGTIRAFGK